MKGCSWDVLAVCSLWPAWLLQRAHYAYTKQVALERGELVLSEEAPAGHGGAASGASKRHCQQSRPGPTADCLM